MIKCRSNIALEEFMGGIDITNAIWVDDVSLINQSSFDDKRDSNQNRQSKARTLLQAGKQTRHFINQQLHWSEAPLFSESSVSRIKRKAFKPGPESVQ